MDEVAHDPAELEAVAMRAVGRRDEDYASHNHGEDDFESPADISSYAAWWRLKSREAKR